MIKIGITGGIGSGKSTVSKLFELLGVPVYYADTAAKELMNDDVSVKAKVVELFGENVVLNNNVIDRKAIATIVFKDKEKLQLLNEIIHPAVAKHFNNWLLKYGNVSYILKEAAILFESSANKQVDKVIVVAAPKQLRIERVISRDGLDSKNIEQRMNNQLADDELMKLADYIIYNDESQSVINQVLATHKKITE